MATKNKKKSLLKRMLKKSAEALSYPSRREHKERGRRYDIAKKTVKEARGMRSMMDKKDEMRLRIMYPIHNPLTSKKTSNTERGKIARIVDTLDKADYIKKYPKKFTSSRPKKLPEY